MEEIHERKILELVPDAKNRVFLLKEFADISAGGRNIPDPIGGTPDVYRRTLAIIKEAVNKVEKLI
jgi:hypothetical protein